MYLISKDEYESQKQTCAEHDHLIDSIKGNINGGQVNHIELSEGGKVVIKPSDISASVKKSNKSSGTSAVPKASDIIVNASEKNDHPSFSSPHSQLHGHEPNSRKVIEEESSKENDRGDKRKLDEEDTSQEESPSKRRKIDEIASTGLNDESGSEERKIDDKVFDEVRSNENTNSLSDDPESISKRRPVPVDRQRESEILSSLNVGEDKETERSDELMNLLDEIGELSEKHSQKTGPNLNVYHGDRTSNSSSENPDVAEMINDRLKDINNSSTQSYLPEIHSQATETSKPNLSVYKADASSYIPPKSTLSVYKADTSTYTPPKQYTKKNSNFKTQD